MSNNTVALQPADRVETRAAATVHVRSGGGATATQGAMYVPPLNYGDMAASTYLPNPARQQSSYRQTVSVDIWLPPLYREGDNEREVTEEHPRSKMAITIGQMSTHSIFSGPTRLSWLLTQCELVLPGSAAHLKPTNVTLVYRRISGVAWNLFTMGVRVPDATEAVPLPEPVTVTPADIAAMLPTTSVGEFELRGLVDFPADYGPLDAGAYLGQLFYTVVKTPTPRNAVGFTERRPQAAAQSIGRSGPMPPALIPSTALLVFCGSLFTGNPALRESVGTELVNWVLDSDISATQAACVAQVRLWRGHGLSGMFMVRDMMLNLGGILREVASLASDITWHSEHLARYHACRSPNRDYRNAIYGPRSDVASRGDYKNLVTLARDIQVLGGAQSMANFGARGQAGDARGGLSVPEHIMAAIRAAANRADVAIPLAEGEAARR